MSPAYTISTIAASLKADILMRAEDTVIHHLGYDSRILPQPAGTLFFAIKGKKHDGHSHLYECFLKGVRCFVIEDQNSLAALPKEALAKVNVLLVPDSIAAMQSLAAMHRSRHELHVVAITGSNGKTVVKEWLFQLLHPEFTIVRSPKSYNSQIGVPLSVWQIGKEHSLGIFEAGISQPGEMEALARVIQPGIGIFTNIGEAHAAHFSSLQQKAEEKLKLFYGCELLIYCSDYKEIEEAVRKAREMGAISSTKLIAWSQKENAETQVRAEKKHEKAVLHILFEGKEQRIEIPFADEASIENLIHCSLLMLNLGYDAETINSRMQKLHAVEMRLELKQGINGCTIINDSYNSDLHSLSIALDTLNQQQQHSQKTLILSDILESGREEDVLYTEVAQLLKQKGVDKLIGIGPALSRQIHRFDEENYFYPDTQSFLKEHELNRFRDEAILLKGSRAFGFEAIARRLSQKSHQTVLQINLSALVHNLNVYRSLLRPSTKVMAMVKAFSYGSGSYEIANELQFHKADYLAVAYADEGVYLRQNGISLPIMVMNPEEEAFEAMIRHRLEPEIYSFRTLQQFRNAAGNLSAYPVHLKIDTGMHRLGFSPEELPRLLTELEETPQLHVQSVFSHLASSDVPAHDHFTQSQISTFEQICSNISECLGYSFVRHILNSSGVVRFPEAQFDMVRLGIGLYGIDPADQLQQQLEVVNTLKTHISQIRPLTKGDTVGYSRLGVADSDRTIATLGIGYADGFPRALGNGAGQVWLNGRTAPLIGSVCMDMCMVDITGIPAEEGDEVIVFGKELPVEQVAARMNTIAYEILTSVSQRVKRVYFKE